MRLTRLTELLKRRDRRVSTRRYFGIGAWAEPQWRVGRTDPA